MKRIEWRSDALLLLAAVIWGFAFVAQRVGMDHVGPFLFNAIRFALGALVIFPLMMISGEGNAALRKALPGGLLVGLVLFLGASLQQMGIVYTTAGKAGFITGLYVVIVPLLGLMWKQNPGTGGWVGALLAVAGLFLLSVHDGWRFAPGDSLVLLGAFFWACHVLIIGRLTQRAAPVPIAFVQFVVCSFLSSGVAFFRETATVDRIAEAAVPILYGGLISVGIAYTLQIVAQKKAAPAHAALILSLETVFAAIGGWLILSETLSIRGITGCVLILTGILLSRLYGSRRAVSAL